MTIDMKRLVAAGLTILVTCFGALPAAMAAAPPGRYDLNADTVVDTVTGLVWQRAVPSTPVPWANAAGVCANLNLGQVPVGTWRLPRKLEFESIVDYFGVFNPAIDGTAFPGTLVVQFWSSSPYAGASGYAWTINMNGGPSGPDDMGSSHLVRCVHDR